MGPELIQMWPTSGPKRGGKGVTLAQVTVMASFNIIRLADLLVTSASNPRCSKTIYNFSVCVLHTNKTELYDKSVSRVEAERNSFEYKVA